METTTLISAGTRLVRPSRLQRLGEFCLLAALLLLAAATWWQAHIIQQQKMLIRQLYHDTVKPAADGRG